VLFQKMMATVKSRFRKKSESSRREKINIRKLRINLKIVVKPRSQLLIRRADRLLFATTSRKLLTMSRLLLMQKIIFPLIIR
jgi:hypothetical protein